MKSLKLFSAALAVIALASCSNDELLTINDEQIVKDPSKLYVTAEPLIDGDAEPVTRAGFVYGKTASGSFDGQYLVWTKNDQVKVYDYENNWRPQIWEYDAAATEAYKKIDGFSVFSKPIKQKAGYDQYTNGYGVMPANMAKFIDEDRNRIEFDLSALKNYDLSQAAVTDVYADGKLAKAPLPLWGVATSGEMKVKYLTGVLKVDIYNVPVTAAGSSKWLVIYANKNAGADGINLHPNSLITDAAGADKFDPEDTDNAPVLKGTSNAGVVTTPASTITKANVPADVILVKLGSVTGRTCVAVPIVPIAGATISAYLATTPDANATIAAGEQTLIAPAITKDIQAGHFYRIQDAGAATITDANTPYQLAQRIKEIDAASNRDYTITITQNVTVDDQGGDTHGYVIDLSDYAMKFNATIQFAAGKGFVGKNDNANTLIIKTAASEKTITFNINEPGNTLKAIKVDESLAGPLKLTGAVTHNIEAGSANLTIAATAAQVNATAETNVDGAANITALTIMKGCTKLNAKGGTITTVNFGAYNATPANDKSIAADVEIFTPGNAHIGTVDFTNVPSAGTGAAKDFTKKVTFTSKWDGTASDGTLTTISNAVGAGDYIISAAQLKGYAGAAAANVLAKEIDLDQKTWTGVALAANFDGNYNKLTPAGSAKVPARAQTTIKNVKGAQGLFASIAAATVSNITFDGTNTITGAANATNIGLLAGATTGTTTIKNITVNGATVSAPQKSVSLGGVIGEATSGALTLENVNVVANVTGYQNVGGIIGYVAAGTVKFGVQNKNNGTVDETGANAYKSDNIYCAATATLAHNDIAAVEYSPNYATEGQFIGSKAAAATVTICQNTLPAYTDATVAAKAMWSELTGGDLVRYSITKKQTYVGFSGISAGANNAPQKDAAWVDVNFYGDYTQTGSNKAYKTRVYNVKATKIASPADDAIFYLNVVNK